MKKRLLGKSRLNVSILALGTNVFGWTVHEPQAFQILDAFVEAGGSLLDTADSYSRWAPGNSGGESESMIGKWLAASGKRSQVIIATKVGSPMGPGKGGLSKKYILAEVEESLRRLRTDVIDLYQSHFDDPNTPIEETLEAFSILVKDGKVREIGASNFSAERLSQSLRAAKEHGYPLYRSLQPQYNLYDRQHFEQSVERICLENGLGVITYFSLAHGFLSGKYRSKADLSRSVRGSSVGQYLNARGFRILSALDEVAEKYNAAPAAISLAWLISRPAVTAPITSATSIEQVNQVAAAADIILDRQSLDLLDKASDWRETGEMRAAG